MKIRQRLKSLLKRRILPLGYFFRRYAYRERTGNEALVLMCLWNRPTRLPEILRMLDRQDYPDGVRLFIWNNARHDHRRYCADLRAHRSSGSLVDVSIVKSPLNVGSIGRFYWAAWIARSKQERSVIIIDDDQNVADDFVSTASAAARPRTLTAWWAFVVTGDYWHRIPAAPGDAIDHVGPGGMVTDVALFRERAFFRALPEKYWMLDDIWISAFALSRGFRLDKLPTDIEFVMPETNQYHGQISLKDEFYASLADMRRSAGG